MSGVLSQLTNKRTQAAKELENLEKQIYELEGDYLNAEYTQCGTVFKGFEGFLSSKEQLRKRNRGFQVQDRAWSLSSKTSPATYELEQAMLESLPETASRGGKGMFAGKGAGQKGRRGQLL